MHLQLAALPLGFHPLSKSYILIVFWLVEGKTSGLMELLGMLMLELNARDLMDCQSLVYQTRQLI